MEQPLKKQFHENAYTVCSANYLPFAKALGDSLLQHNPDFTFIIALADTFNDYDAAFFAPQKIVPVQEMQVPSLDELNSRYNIFELSCALKPFVAQFILASNKECSVLFYFDSDILLYGPLTLAETILQDNFLVLTPHLAVPLPYDISVKTEMDVLKTGLYNAGFFGLSNRAETMVFLDWWKKRLQHHCYNNAANGLFVDQLWLNFAPLYFRKTCVLFDPGYNLAYWNFSERKLSEDKGALVVNEKHPLVFYHFSGYDFALPEAISKHHQTYTFENMPEYRPLFAHFRDSVMKNKAEAFFALVPGMGKPPTAKKPEKRKGFFKRKFQKLFG
jgi:hypothetical protein